MDGLTHPVGDQPSNVYWKRRLAVIAAIVVLALLLWWLISSLGGGSGTPATTPGPTVSSTLSSSPSASVSADLGRACTKDDITVTAGPANSNFAGNKVPTFTVTVASKSDSPCIVDPTTASKIVVKSGSDVWFDSSKCTGDYKAFDAESFLIQPGAEQNLETSWNGGRDDAGCAADATAKSGYYWITATVGGVSAEKLQFQIS